MSDSRNYSIKQLAKMEQKVARQSRTILFLTILIVAYVLMYFLSAPTFTVTQQSVLFILFFAIGLWITEAVPPFAVGILIVGFLVFTMGRDEGMDAKRYAQVWSDGVIWLFLGGFFLAEGMKKTNLDVSLLKLAAPKFGNQQKMILFGLMLVTAILSMLMSNTATTAMMIATVSPLFLMAGKESNFSKALVLGIPTAAAIGGMGTIIGSAPNAIAVGAMESIGIKISFIEWMLVGVPVSLILLFVFWRMLLHKYQLKNQTISLDFLLDAPASSEEEMEKLEESKIKKQIVLVVMGVTLLLWLTSQLTKIPVAAVSGIPIVALTLLGIIDADDVRSLPWDTLMLVAGGLALGMAIQEQGLATYFVDQVSHYDINLYALVVIFSLVTVVFSNFMSNTAATTIFIPIAISLIGLNADFDPVIFPLVIGLSASCALLLPVSTPPNAIAYSTGIIQQQDFRMGGIGIGLIGPLVIIAFTMLYSWLF
ncbi:MAG: DASS family sodium-coupled anion symporter [Flavobacteriales bacterium]|jgi:solute carrier family 13 (sodium-dependent dicarboxylate transporter), member 2/3/5|nr:DASS family sodium-coupled anion symporter [Flavobacteriales bacterium]